MSIQVNSEAQRTAEVRERHRQEVRQQIILPVVLTLIVFIIVPPLGILLLTSTRQVGIIASFATVMVLVPVVVLCVVPYALLLVMLALTNKLNRNMPDLLRTGRNIAYGINQEHIAFRTR